MTPYRVSAREDASATERDEVAALARAVRGPVALQATLVLVVSIFAPALLFWHQWLAAGGRSFHCF